MVHHGRGQLQAIWWNTPQGWRKLTGAQLMHVLNLGTMEYMGERRRVVKTMGQKLLIVTRRGIELIGERLIKGQQQYFDVCVTELIGRNRCPALLIKHARSDEMALSNAHKGELLRSF